ncbi:uncharacterized protein [Henckelia pumila]|uniref:uncharacterized protein n=1 Tax=Henckelia pumila TaxID=405737 RepID=UPI003C6DE927
MCSAMKTSGTKSYDSKYPALSKSHRVQGMSLSRLRGMCDVCIAKVKHENVDEEIDAEFPPELPVGGGITHINADKSVALKNLGEIALKFYNDTKSKNFKLAKVCKVNTIAFRYKGVTFRAQEDGSEESPLFRAVVFVMREPLFCEIKEEDEVTLLPDVDDYAGPKGACEIEDFPPSICPVETKGINSYHDSENSDGLSATAYMIQSLYDSKYPENTSAIEPSDKISHNDSKFPAKTSAVRAQRHKTLR